MSDMFDFRFEATAKKKTAVTCKKNRDRKNAQKRKKKDSKESKDERIKQGMN